MKTERGFVTIFALCLILVIALLVKGIQESDANRNTSADALLAEFDLQNAADGGIYEAAEIVRSGQKELPASGSADPATRQSNQIPLVTRSFDTLHGKIRVNVWGERLKIQYHKREYSPTYKKVEIQDGNKKVIVKYGYVLFGVAQLDSPRFGKMYRRAFAYVVDGCGIEYYYRFGYSNNGNRPVEPKPEDMIDGTEGDEAVYNESLGKFFVVVKPEEKDTVHFIELPSRKDE